MILFTISPLVAPVDDATYSVEYCSMIRRYRLFPGCRFAWSKDRGQGRVKRSAKRNHTKRTFDVLESIRTPPSKHHIQIRRGRETLNPALNRPCQLVVARVSRTAHAKDQTNWQKTKTYAGRFIERARRLARSVAFVPLVVLNPRGAKKVRRVRDSSRPITGDTYVHRILVDWGSSSIRLVGIQSARIKGATKL
jgi:hypothetical protein